jgi:hypothetical protein
MDFRFKNYLADFSFKNYMRGFHLQVHLQDSNVLNINRMILLTVLKVALILSPIWPREDALPVFYLKSCNKREQCQCHHNMCAGVRIQMSSLYLIPYTVYRTCMSFKTEVSHLLIYVK